MFAEIGARLRDIRSGPDGALYILSEGENGKIWRVSKP
jgi:glucose/arabinose dehydrogenase